VKRVVKKFYESAPVVLQRKTSSEGPICYSTENPFLSGPSARRSGGSDGTGRSRDPENTLCSPDRSGCSGCSWSPAAPPAQRSVGGFFRLGDRYA